MKKKTSLSFNSAMQVYQGYLEGTHKSAHTMKNYRFDVQDFRAFLNREYSVEVDKVDQITRKDLENYRDHLKERGLKNNTRRRKILTVTQFMQFLAKRNKISSETAQKVSAPSKIERIPYVVSSSELIGKIRNLEASTLIDRRNQVLLWTLAETGCLVSEVCGLKFENWQCASNGKPELHFYGKSNRILRVSEELFAAVQGIRHLDDSYLFYGFNKFGPLGSPISPRGVELLVKSKRAQFNLEQLTPRTFRHSIIVEWFNKGVSQDEIQKRLGLKSAYAFRSYRSLIKSKSETTSTS